MPVIESINRSMIDRPTLRFAMAQADQAQSGRRSGRRHSFDYRLLLTPLDETPRIHQFSADPIYVYGRDLGAQGIGFEHQESLVYRKVRLRAADERLEELGYGDLEIDVVLRWCRFLATGTYESGGRIARTTVPLF